MTAKARESSGTSSSVTIVVNSAKPDYGPHPVQGTVIPVIRVPQQHETVPVHNRNITCAVDSYCRSVSLPTSDTTGAAVPSLQRRPKIRRTGEYDDLHTMVSWSNTI